MFSTRPFRVLFGVMILSALFTAPLFAAPIPSVDDDVTDPFPHRRAEAERKAVLYEGLTKAIELRTANQDLYDVIHYDLDLTLDPVTNSLSGTVIVTAEVLGASMAVMDLDLTADMTVSAATSDGGATTWTRPGDLVTVDLDRTYTTGETVVVSVTYSGDPAGDAFGWSSADGLDMIWTLSEPYGSREWWPCKDLNTDKADSLDIRVTVPDNLIVASNGLLVSDIDNGSTRTFHWRTNYPTVTYLVSLAIHPYTMYSDWYTPLGGGDPMEVQFYVYASHYTSVQATYALTVPMIETFAQGFGEYPFVNEKYGHAEFVWGGGMEHQTLTSLGGWSEDLISHELAHQWWGDMITCDNFQHIWLNEGFATWCEAYWKEQTDSFATYQLYMEYAAYYGAGTIFVEDPADFGAIFNSNLSYNKGSWVVHMLRGVVGDTAFFAGLADYRTQYEYGSATTEQLRDVMEAASGLDLDAFFQQWIYGDYFPVYAYGWSQSGGDVTVSVDQVQSLTGLFDMPVDVRVIADVGTYDFTVQVTQATEDFVLGPISGTVQSVTLDPDDWILCQIQTSVENPSFDQGILLVNGVDWNTYGSDITSAYADSIFTGNHDFTFWDVFDTPAGGYVAQLPTPAGHGSVPGEELGKYSSVVWVGNNYNGDLAKWQETPIASYLDVGGNVLLLTRWAAEFIAGNLQTYMGITWTATGGTLANCIADHPELIDMTFTSTQSWCDVFSTDGLPARTTLLFSDTLGFGSVSGLGAYTIPETVPSHREDGGRLAFVGARPYRLAHASLRANTQTILDGFFSEPYDPLTAVHGSETPGRMSLAPNRPNPFNPRTVIPFSLPRSGRVELAVYDVAGRLVRTLLHDDLPAGGHEAVWRGLDDRGRAVASGSYFARLRTSYGVEVRSVTLVR